MFALLAVSLDVHLRHTLLTDTHRMARNTYAVDVRPGDVPRYREVLQRVPHAEIRDFGMFWLVRNADSLAHSFHVFRTESSL